MPEYVILALNAGVSKDFLESQKSGMADSQVNISQAKLRQTPIPVAPTREQERIVAKVNQLMSLCDQLDEGINRQESNKTNIPDAITSAVLSN